jgi:hypothetical protein
MPLPKSYRVAVLVFFSVGVLTFAQALNFDICTAKLEGINAPQAQRSSLVATYVTFAMSVVSLIAFSFFGVRGMLIVKHRQRSNQSMQPTAGRSEANPSK